jgi:hypothetical protein
LHTATLLAGWPAATRAAGAAAACLAAAWDDERGGHWAGLLAASPSGPLRVLRAIELPTRAHALLAETGGTLIVIARRPGDWMLRWSPGSSRAQWLWSQADRRFSGHVVAHGDALCTTETDLESGQGLVAWRDLRTLAMRTESPTHGIDPHQLLADADGSLLVANGGVPTQPETGRAKLDRRTMDASLVRLDGRSGARLGQWRLADARLSIRHLARHADGTLGVALQAEHDDAAARAGAPLLALFDGRSLRTAPQAQALAGYGGDIAATAQGFAVAAPRAGCVARWTRDGRWRDTVPLTDVCALALDDGELWAGGSRGALQGVETGAARHHAVPALRLDNHWVAWSAPGPASTG